MSFQKMCSLIMIYLLITDISVLVTLCSSRYVIVLVALECFHAFSALIIILLDLER